MATEKEKKAVSISMKLACYIGGLFFLLGTIVFIVWSKPIKEEDITYIETTVLVVDPEFDVIYTEDSKKYIISEDIELTNLFEELKTDDWIKIGFVEENDVVYLESQAGIILSVFEYNESNKKQYTIAAIVSGLCAIFLFVLPFFSKWEKLFNAKNEKELMYKFTKNTKSETDPKVYRSNMYFDKDFWHVNKDNLSKKTDYSEAADACFYELLSDGKAEVILYGDKLSGCDISLIYRDEGKLMTEYLDVDDDGSNYSFYYKLADWSYPEYKKMSNKQREKMKEAMEEVVRIKRVPLIFKEKVDF
jgi:hypothetical protein